MFTVFLEAVNKKLDIDLHRADAYTEAAGMEAAIAIEEGELKMMTESVDDDETRMMILEEAQDGFIGKVKNAIGKIIDAIKDFFKKIKEKIISVFSKKETDATIEKIEKKVKINPIFRNKKVKVKDVEAEKTLIQKYKAKLASFTSKIKSGGKVTKDEVEEARDGFTRKHAIIIASTVAVTLTAAIALLKKRASKIGQEVKSNEDNSIKALEGQQTLLLTNSDKIEDAEVVGLLETIAQQTANAAKLEANADVNGVSEILREVKSSVTGGSNATPTDKDTKDGYDDTNGESAYESASDYDQDEDVYVTLESAEDTDDMASQFEALLGN